MKGEGEKWWNYTTLSEGTKIIFKIFSHIISKLGMTSTVENNLYVTPAKEAAHLVPKENKAGTFCIFSKTRRYRSHDRLSQMPWCSGQSKTRHSWRRAMRGLGSDSGVKSLLCCPCKGPWFGSQHLQDSSQWLLTPVPAGVTSLVASTGTCTHVVCCTYKPTWRAHTHP